MSQDNQIPPTDAPKTTPAFVSDYQKKLIASWMDTHSDSEYPPIRMGENGQALWINRKQRRRQKAFVRRAPKLYPNGLEHWIKRTMKEMKQSPRVQEKVAAGELDQYLTQDTPQLVDITDKTPNT